MLSQFCKYTWIPYLVSVGVGSLLIAVLSSIPSGSIDVLDILNFTFVILCFAIPVTLIITMPIAFLTWIQLQQRKISLSHLQAGIIGFVAGSILYTIFLLSFNGLEALPSVLLFATLCGGGYGLIFSLMFSLSGGLVPININEPNPNQTNKNG